MATQIFASCVCILDKTIKSHGPETVCNYVVHAVSLRFFGEKNKIPLYISFSAFLAFCGVLPVSLLKMGTNCT